MTQVGTTTPLYSTPYITIDEYKQAPTSIDVDDLVGGAASATNDVELANVVARASSWIDSYCGQVLASTTDTESFRARISRDGFLKIHPRFFPVQQVVALSYGPTPALMTSVDVSTVWIEPMSVVAPLSQTTITWQGPLQFNTPVSWTDQFVNVTYVNGYANALTSNTSAIGATSIPVTDRTGFIAGDRFTIYDGVNTEILQVSTSQVPSSGAGNILLASPATKSHASGVSVSALPPAIKQAAIFMTSAILKARGSQSIVMGGLTPGLTQDTTGGQTADIRQAQEILKPYRRIR